MLQNFEVYHVQVPSQFVMSRVELCIKMLSHTICNKLTLLFSLFLNLVYLNMFVVVDGHNMYFKPFIGVVIINNKDDEMKKYNCHKTVDRIVS